jgi:cell wall-associated NlpC family hydrolase
MILNEQEQSKVVELAIKLLGKKYKLGSEDISDDLKLNKKLEDITEIDCSELIEWVFWNALHIKVPDGSFNQFPVCDLIAVENGEAGDIVFRKRKPATPDEPAKIYHVGIYCGNDVVIEAFSEDRGVIQRTLSEFMKESNTGMFAGMGRLNLSKI